MMTPLHLASQRGNVEVVRKLMQGGAGVNAVSRKGNSPLHNAAWEGMTEVVQVLLRGGADTKLRNGSSCTALDLATERHHEDILKLLAAQDKAP